MFKNMKLGTKLLTSFLAVGVLPFAIIAIVSLLNGSNSLSQQAFNQLYSVQAIKKSQIENYFQERMGDVSVLAGNPFVSCSLIVCPLSTIDFSHLKFSLFIETPIFTKLVSELIPDDEYRKLQLALVLRPKAGIIIPGKSSSNLSTFF